MDNYQKGEVFYCLHLQNFLKDYHRSSPREQIQTGIFLNKYLILNPDVETLEWFLAKCYNKWQILNTVAFLYYHKYQRIHLAFVKI